MYACFYRQCEFVWLQKTLKNKEWNFLPFHIQRSIICQCKSYSSIFVLFFLHRVITAFDLWLTSALGRSCSSSNGVDLGERCEPPTAPKKKQKNRGTKSCPEDLFRKLQNIFNHVQWGVRLRLIMQSTTVQKKKKKKYKKAKKGSWHG